MPIIMKDPIEEMNAEIAKSLEKYGSAAIIDLCLPSKLNMVNGFDGPAPAPIHDPIRDQYLIRALTYSTLGDWTGSWKKMSECPKCDKVITRTRPKTLLEKQAKAVICDDCLEILIKGVLWN